MKNRLLAQILILCMMFSALPMTVRAADEKTPSPYIEGVLNNGQISANKSLTVIATSSDLYITKFTLKAIDADNGKVNNLVASSSLQVSPAGYSCYEYKQSFSLTKDLKINGGKWMFEVTSTYKDSMENPKINSSSRMLPSSYEKAHWYSYYTIVNDALGTVPPPDDPPVLPSDEPTVPQPDDSPVLPPDESTVPQPNDPPVILPDKPTTPQPDDSPVLPPDESTVPQPNDPQVTLPDNPSVLPSDSPSVSPSEGLPIITNPRPTGSAVDASLTAHLYAGASAARINASDVQKILHKTIPDSTGNVNINVNLPNHASVDSVQVDLPSSVISDLTGRTNASLTVTTPLAAVTLPNGSLRQIGRSANGFTVTIASDDSSTRHIALMQDGRTLEDLPSGLKVEIPTNNISRTSGVVAVQINRYGAETILPKSVLQSNGNLAIQLDTGSTAISYQDRSADFSDVSSGYWASDAINFVSSHGLFQGTTNSIFNGSAAMNRAMLVTVLHRLEGSPYVGTYSFADVPTDSYYAQAAAWASRKGIVQGRGNSFGGSHAVTRQEIVVMLYRYMRTNNDSAGQLGSYYGMDGADQVADWADEAMRWAVGSGIIQGDNGGLKPQNSATRAEVAQMIVNFVRLITQ